MDRIAAEVVKLDAPEGAYGVCSQASRDEHVWVVFTGPDAGRRAWAYADATFDDVRTGRHNPARRTRALAATPFELRAG